MKKISLVAASLVFATGLAAESDFHKALTGGEVSGDITLYGEKQSNDTSKDSGFTNGSIGLGYETADFNGFKLALGFRANHDFSEEEDGDFGDNTKSILHTANISYTNAYFGLTVGRQEVGLEWIGDFHEAAVLGIKAIPDTTLTVAYTNRTAVADADAGLEKFDKFATKEGIYLVDAVYEGVEGLALNAYYYDADKLASWYGLKADYDTDMFGVTVHGATSDEESSSQDGEIIHFEARTAVSGLSVNAGYISTDKDAGAGSMPTLDDNISPFEDGNQVYGADADTAYLGLAYEVSGVELGAIYGQTDFGQFEESELNLTADYGINDNLSVGAIFIDVDADEKNGDEDYNKVTLTLEYTF